MDIYKFKQQLGRYLKGKSNETENAVIEAWYKSYQSQDNEPLNHAEQGRIRLSIRAKIDQAIVDPVKSFKIYYSMAASIVVAGSVALLFCLNAKKTIAHEETFTSVVTKAGGVKQIMLPDSTLVWINAASRIRIPSSFNGPVRKVYLDEGEAFFDVKHKAHNPFVVHVAALQVQVLGTSFNIKAYHSLPQLKVTVATGKVAVTEGTRRLSFLTPGRELSYSRGSKSYYTRSVNPDEIQSWKAGDTYLNQAGFDELVLVFKNLFGIQLKAGNTRVNTYQFTLRVHKNLPAEETLKAVSLMHNTHFRKEGNEVFLY
jgi:transmembrane sensor